MSRCAALEKSCLLLLLYCSVLAQCSPSNWPDWIIVPARVDTKINNNYQSDSSVRSYPLSYYNPLQGTVKTEPYVLAISKQNGQDENRNERAVGGNFAANVIVDKLKAVYEVAQEFFQADDEESNSELGSVSSRKMKVKKLKKKYKKYLFPLLLAYKLKFLTLVPLLIGGLVLLVGATGMAGFFFALFASIMSLRTDNKVVYKNVH